MTLVRYVQVALALGLLIFIHELGHFLAAKWAGVRVEVFSLGFGPFLLSFRRGETVYALSLVPLGGYVRMTGQADIGRVKDREKMDPRSYAAKPPWRRAIIIGAGVAMNAAMAHVVFTVAYLFGVPTVPAELGRVVDGGPAHEAGLVEGDRVLRVGGTSVRTFGQFESAIATRTPGRPVEVLVSRNGVEVPVTVVPRRSEGRGLSVVDVLQPAQPRSLAIGARASRGVGVGPVRPESPAERAGLREGDVIVSVAGEPVDGIEGLVSRLGETAGAEVEIGFVRGGRPATARAAAERLEIAPGGPTRYRLGFEVDPARFVEEVEPDSPAARAGLVPWSRVTRVTASAHGTNAELAWRGPDGRARSAVVPFVEGALSFDAGLDVKETAVSYPFGQAAVEGAREVGRVVAMTCDVLVGLARRNVGAEALSGPARIAYFIYYSTRKGLGFYLYVLGVISVNLVVINLLPLLPFDGGILAFLGYEAVRRKPANERLVEALQIAGIVLVLALVVYVTRNDISWLGSREP